MSTTGLEVFDRTINKTNALLFDVLETLECGDRHQAYAALRATLHALRERLTIEEAATSLRSCRCSFAASITRGEIQPANRQ